MEADGDWKLVAKVETPGAPKRARLRRAFLISCLAESDESVADEKK